MKTFKELFEGSDIKPIKTTDGRLVFSFKAKKTDKKENTTSDYTYEVGYDDYTPDEN